MTRVVPIKVGLDTSVARWDEEVKYVFRTLLRVAGFAHEFVWIGEGSSDKSLDIYYGPKRDVAARITIESDADLFVDPKEMEVHRVEESGGISFLDFRQGETRESFRSSQTELRFSNDIVFACYWLLTGSRESHYRRDKWDNFHLDGSSFLKNSLAAKPLVSVYGSLIRTFFKELGYEPLELPWTKRNATAAFVLSHDVDYPQIIRSIECLRLLKSRGLKGLRSIKGVLDGSNHFWKFADWVEYEKQLGARSAFYFMARKGSLYQYATGTPDGFYDIRSPEFTELFRYLRDEGCEIGLHASYHAHRDVEQLRRERTTLEEAAGVTVTGNRHHYWHLDPTAPHETLHKHEQTGLIYDSSLAFEFYPGFRRGVCHPFRPFHPAERREMNVLELPPTWMDDHFDRRLLQNGIANPVEYAHGLVRAAQETGGIVVVDYHPRGMNADFYPRYGSWFTAFAEKHLDSSVSFQTPGEIAVQYLDYEKQLDQQSLDVNSHVPEIKGERPVAKSVNSRVDVFSPKDYAEWDAFVENHPDGHIYQTTAWKNVTEEAFGHRGFLIGEFRDDVIVAGLPLFLVKGLRGRELVSVPLRDRGGPLFRDQASCEMLLRKAKELAHELGARNVVIKFPTQDCADAMKAGGFREESHWVTTFVPLTQGPDEIWNTVLRSPTRRAVKKARNAGLECRWSENKDDLSSFYRVFLKTRKQLGVPPYALQLFLAIHKHLISKKLARLLVVEKDGQIIAGLIVFTYKNEVVSAYMGSDADFSDVRVNDLLFWEAIRWSSEAGYQTFYFGADSPHQDGLLAFKRKWGGDQFVIPNYRYSTNGTLQNEVDSSDPKFKLHRRIVSALPTPVFRFLGAQLTRRLS